MSRIIVKNLPSSTVEDDLRKLFASYGSLTDCQLKFDSKGLFRRFAYIGFSSDDEAMSAMNKLNNTYIKNCKINIELCKSLNVTEKLSGKSKKLSVCATMKTLKIDDKLVIVENLPLKTKSTLLRHWLLPVRPINLKLLRKDTCCSAAVKVSQSQDIKHLLERSGQYFGGQKLIIAKNCAAIEEKELLKAKQHIKQNDKFKYQEITAVEHRAFTDQILETGRIFIRNLAYSCVSEQIWKLFETFGPLADLIMPITAEGKPKGFAIATFVFPEHALKAYNSLDGSIFQGRMLHLLPGDEQKDNTADVPNKDNSNVSLSNYKQTKLNKQKNQSLMAHNWNSLFLGSNAVANLVSEQLGIAKMDILDPLDSGVGVRMAMAETQLVQQTKTYLSEYGVCLDAFDYDGSDTSIKRSDRVILVKNLPVNANSDNLRKMFENHGRLGRFVLPPGALSSIIEYMEPLDARKAFKALAYRRFQTVPLFLEWAPERVFIRKNLKSIERSSNNNTTSEIEKPHPKPQHENLLISSLSSKTDDDALLHFLRSRGFAVQSCKVARNSSKISLGYAFIKISDKQKAKQAVVELHDSLLDGSRIKLKLCKEDKKADIQDSDCFIPIENSSANITEEPMQSTKTKILVRNIPFQAKSKELRKLFSAFGEIKFLRLPNKIGGEQHRGFCFVDYTNALDAKKAFDSMRPSTHLYGRRLVLEWAKEDENIESLRRRTLQHYREGHPDSKKIKLDDDNIDIDY